MVLPTGSVNFPAATSIVHKPSALGVNVAVLVTPLPAKSERAPLLTSTSPTTKLLITSFEVKVSARVASLEVAPLLTSAAVIAIVGSVSSAEVKFQVVSSDIPA